MAEVLFWVAVALLPVVVVLLAYTSRRRHLRAARARSLAALNRLLAEADEIAQSRREAPDGRETDS